MAKPGLVKGIISYGNVGGSIQESFDTLPFSGSSTWVNDSTLPGWSLFIQPAPGLAPPTILAGDGSGNTGSFYSFGLDGSRERAFGGLGSGSSYFGSPASSAVAGWIAVAITNSTGLTLRSFELHYDGEQWRNGGNISAQTMVMQYGFGSSFGEVSVWVSPGDAFNFTSPVVGSTATALDGNQAGNRLGELGGVVSNLAWSSGQTLWIRWIEVNDAGNDHGLAIDNWRFSAVVPEPSLISLPLCVGWLPGVGRRWRC